MEIRPTTRRFGAGEKQSSRLPGASGAQMVVLVSCHEFAGSGPWMSPEEEQEFVEDSESEGRRVARLGAEVAEPWRI